MLNVWVAGWRPDRRLSPIGQSKLLGMNECLALESGEADLNVALRVEASEQYRTW